MGTYNQRSVACGNGYFYLHGYFYLMGTYTPEFMVHFTVVASS